MSDKPLIPKFDPKSTPQVREPLLNAYGFDLTDLNEIGFVRGKFKFTVLGFRITSAADILLATVKVTFQPHVHPDYVYVRPKLNLYDPERINGFSREAAFQLKVTQEEIKTGISDLRERLERFRLDELKGLSAQTQKAQLSKKQREAAKEILKSDNVMECIEGLLRESGLVTELSNGLRLFLILLTRNFDSPLHGLLQGSSQMCRLLMEKVMATLSPDQLREMTSQSMSSLYHNRNREYWRNKVLYVKGIDKHFKGVSTIREFLENKVLHRHTTESDPVTRQLYASQKIVPGPICLVGFSEDDSINQRFFAECFFLRVEENEKNKAELLEYRKKEFAGMVDESAQHQAVLTLQAIQQLVQPVKIIVPFAQSMQLPSSVAHPLRSFSQLITFVKAVTLLHQFNCKQKTDSAGGKYIEATPEHLSIALELFRDIALEKSDMLSLSEREFFEKLKSHVKDPQSVFRIGEVIKRMRISKSSFYRAFSSLRELGYIRECGGNKREGMEFIITEWKDFAELQKEVSLFTDQMEQLKSQVSHKFPRSFPMDSQQQNPV